MENNKSRAVEQIFDRKEDTKDHTNKGRTCIFTHIVMFNVYAKYMKNERKTHKNSTLKNGNPIMKLN